MKIIKLQAENVKRLKAVEITPDGNVVVISGKNGQGKTSVLDAIWYALGGGDAQKGTSRPIRDGEQSASVTLDLGDYIITRHWTANDKTYLKVENADGFSAKSPQSLLDGLVGKLSFDPLEFKRMDAKAQLATLLGLVDLSIDPTEIDAQKKAIFEERTQVNRDAKQLEGQIAGLPDVPEDTPDKEIDTTALMEEYQKATETFTANNARRQSLSTARRERLEMAEEIEEKEAEIIRLQTAVKQYKVRLEEQDEQLESLVSEVDALKDPDFDSYKVRMSDAKSINENVRTRADRKRIEDAAKAKKDESAKLTAEITALDDQKAAALREASFPVDGLGFDEGGVTYNGIPFSQCSDGEKLRISLAMALALNPKLRVIRITDGSLLDSENMALIQAMAEERDAQVWIEKVDESGKLGIVIEDGAIKIAEAVTA